MHRYLLIAYVITYCIFAIFLFVAYARLVPEEEKKTDKPWETPLDLIMVTMGLAGMVFLLADLKSDTLKFIWRPVSIILGSNPALDELEGQARNVSLWRGDERRC